jgi:phosphodiesterase/alkaline phosphatase D-like protein
VVDWRPSLGPSAFERALYRAATVPKIVTFRQSGLHLSPSAGMQFFGQVDIDRDSKTMTVSLKDIQGTVLFKQAIAAKGR